MGCMQAIMSCAGWDTFAGVSIAMVHLFCNQGFNDNPGDPFGSTCFVPFYNGTGILEGVVNVCCYDGTCCSTALGMPGFITDQVSGLSLIPLGCVNDTINLCDAYSCLAGNEDLCQDMEETVCEDGNPGDFGVFPIYATPNITNDTFTAFNFSELCDGDGDGDGDGYVDSDDSDDSDDDSDSEVYSAAAAVGIIRNNVAKSFGINFEEIFDERQGENDGLDRVISINGESMTMREFLWRGGELNDKMKMMLSPAAREGYEEIRNEDENVKGDEMEQTEDNEIETKTITISFGQNTFLSFLSMFGVIGMAVLGIGSLIYWCCFHQK